MQATIANILAKPASYANQIVNLDGLLLITDYDRDAAQSQQVWLVKLGQPRNQALRARPISSASTLWHGLSRLNARHLPGYQSYRVHEAARVYARVLGAASSISAPQIEVLTAAVYRREFTLFVSQLGVRLDQALPPASQLVSLPDMQANTAHYLGRRHQVYGTLVLRAAPPSQYLLPGKIPYSGDSQATVTRLEQGQIESDWLADIAYLQSDNKKRAPEDEDTLPESIYIDPHYQIRQRLAVLPGINQTLVKPAVVTGRLAARDHIEHFATLTDIETVYLQNICYTDAGKTLESVIKLKNFADPAAKS